MRRLLRGACGGTVVAALAVFLIQTVAVAHIERASYWPLPGPDCTVHPCAGGSVPAARSLGSALKPSRGSKTRVVCQGDSLRRLGAAIRRARANGYFIRPTD